MDLKNGQGFIKSNEASPELNYKFSITELDENKMTVLFTDIKSGKVMPTTIHFTENNENIVYYVPVPPSVVIPGLGKLVEIMGKAVSSSEIIREGGKYLIDASKATSVANKDKSSYNYFMAKLSKDKLYIGDGINKAAAVKRGKSGKDVWAKSKSLARSLAASVNTKGAPVHDDAHGGEGYYAHYHPYKRTPKMHSFYGTSKK